MPYIKQEKRENIDKYIKEIARLHLGEDELVEFLLNVCGIFRLNISYNSELAERIHKEVKPNGDLNYMIFKLVKTYLPASYTNYKSFMGCLYNVVDRLANLNYKEYRDELRETAEWIRIKLLIPYEEEKCALNGDVTIDI